MKPFKMHGNEKRVYAIIRNNNGWTPIDVRDRDSDLNIFQYEHALASIIKFKQYGLIEIRLNQEKVKESKLKYPGACDDIFQELNGEVVLKNLHDINRNHRNYHTTIAIRDCVEVRAADDKLAYIKLAEFEQKIYDIVKKPQ